MSKYEVAADMAAAINRGERLSVKYDDSPTFEGRTPEGPWYIQGDSAAWCYYPTRQAARDELRWARLRAAGK